MAGSVQAANDRVDRQSTIHAVRDTELIVVSHGLFEVIQQKYPSVCLYLLMQPV